MIIEFRSWVDDHYEYNVHVNKNGKYSKCISTGFALQYDPSYKEYDVEMFTGLTDRDKKYIYLGDIIKLASGRLVVVIFKNGAFGYEIDGEFHGLNNLLAISGYDWRIKVIDNIHTNQGLPS